MADSRTAEDIMMTPDINMIIAKLPPYQGKKRLITTRQDTHDIIREILDLHRRTGADYDRIAPAFWKGDVKGTAENLYYFARKHIPYQVEHTLTQTVKRPEAILAEREKFGNDCKHYASFIVGIAEALRRKGFPVKCFYRFASYNPKNRAPGHVFAVFVDHGKEIWVDPVPEIGGFDRRARQPFFITDKMPPMSKNGSSIGSLYEISGIPIETTKIVAGYDPTAIISGHRHWLDELHPQNRLNKAKQMLHKRGIPLPPGMNGTYDISGYPEDSISGRKGPKKKRGLKIKIKPGKLLAKFGLGPSRNAFLLLVKLNTFHLATKMWTKAARDRNSAAWKKLAGQWEKMGGKADKLYKEIKRGVNTFNKLHPKHRISMSGIDDMGSMDNIGESIDGPEMEGMGMPDDIGYYHDDMSIGDILCFVHDNHAHRMRRSGRRIGVAPAVAAAGVIAAAAPVLKALMGILKSFGVNTSKAGAAADEDTRNLAEAYNNSDNVGPDGKTTMPDGSEAKVTTDPTTGEQKLTVTKLPGTSDKETEAADEAADQDEGVTKTKTVTKKKTWSGDGPGAGIKEMLSNVTSFVSDHKWWFIGGGVAIAAVIILPKIFHRGPQKRRR